MIVTTSTHAIEAAVLRALSDRREYERITKERGYLRPVMTDLDVAESVARMLSLVAA